MHSHLSIMRNKTKRTTTFLATMDEVEPDIYDVLLGRGNGCASWSGNVHFRQVVWKHRQEYKEASRFVKTSIAEKVYDDISSLDPPGRFLKKDDETGYYYEITEETAIEKVCQALREKGMKEPKTYETKSDVAGNKTCALPIPKTPGKKVSTEDKVIDKIFQAIRKNVMKDPKICEKKCSVGGNKKNVLPIPNDPPKKAPANKKRKRSFRSRSKKSSQRNQKHSTKKSNKASKNNVLSPSIEKDDRNPLSLHMVTPRNGVRRSSRKQSAIECLSEKFKTLINRGTIQLVSPITSKKAVYTSKTPMTSASRSSSVRAYRYGYKEYKKDQYCDFLCKINSEEVKKSREEYIVAETLSSGLEETPESNDEMYWDKKRSSDYEAVTPLKDFNEQQLSLHEDQENTPKIILTNLSNFGNTVQEIPFGHYPKKQPRFKSGFRPKTETLMHPETICHLSKHPITHLGINDPVESWTNNENDSPKLERLPFQPIHENIPVANDSPNKEGKASQQLSASAAFTDEIVSRDQHSQDFCQSSEIPCYGNNSYFGSSPGQFEDIFGLYEES